MRESRKDSATGAGSAVDVGAAAHTTDPSQLRYGPAYHTIDFQPVFDWSTDGGFARAVEMCNGSGDCRKASGVMCPSFQATREEEHSTRGRANLLRAALSGQLGAEAWTDPAVERCARPLPGLQGLQDRVPVLGGHGEDQGRGAGAALCPPGCAAACPHLRAHPHPQSAGSAGGAAGQRCAAHLLCPRPGTAGDRTAPGAFPAALCQSYVHRVVCAQNSDGAESGRVKRAGRAFPGHVHNLQLSENRDSGRAGAGSRRLRGAAGRARLLRPADAQPGPGRGCPPPGDQECRPAVSAGRARAADSDLRAELRVGVSRGILRPIAGRRRVSPCWRAKYT